MRDRVRMFLMILVSTRENGDFLWETVFKRLYWFGVHKKNGDFLRETMSECLYWFDVYKKKWWLSMRNNVRMSELILVSTTKMRTFYERPCPNVSIDLGVYKKNGHFRLHGTSLNVEILIRWPSRWCSAGITTLPKYCQYRPNVYKFNSKKHKKWCS